MSTPTSFRALVLPREHGSWAFALEPVALGLLVAPSRAGLWLGLACVAGFFTRRPLKLAFTLPSGDERRPAAWRWTLLLAAVALCALVACSVPNVPIKQQMYFPHSADFFDGSGNDVLNTQLRGASMLWPLLFAIPFGAAFLWFDLRGDSREAEAEIAGSTAFALLPATFATLAGWSGIAALALAALMLARSLPAVLTVRTFVRRMKGRPVSAIPAVTAVAASCAGGFALGAMKLIPIAAGAWIGLLTARAVFLLSPRAPAWNARQVGVAEALIGALYVAGLGLAYRWQ